MATVDGGTMKWVLRAVVGMKASLFAVTMFGAVVFSAAAQASLITFGYTGAIASYIIPVTGAYEIDAFGAAGGTIGGVAGALGGEARGVIALSTGDILSIAVGGHSSFSDEAYSAGGGGGGTFVFLDTSGVDVALVVAGGGVEAAA